jgi:hypothetical protein
MIFERRKTKNLSSNFITTYSKFQLEMRTSHLVAGTTLDFLLDAALLLLEKGYL